MFGIGQKTFKVEVHMNSGKVHKITIPWDKKVNPEKVREYAKAALGRDSDDSRLDLSLNGSRSLQFNCKHVECVEVFD